MRLVCFFVFFGGLCHGVSKAAECTAQGRFPNDDATDCRGFTMCILGGANKFTQYKLTCPVSFSYSHLELQCTNATNYRCLPSYACNTTGNFENPLSKNCSSYVACPEGISGKVTARQVECPLGAVFSPSEGVCVNTGYTCSIDIITTEAATEVPVTVTPEPHNTTMTVLVSGENDFKLLSSISVNGAVDICSKSVLLFVLLVFVNVTY